MARKNDKYKHERFKIQKRTTVKEKIDPYKSTSNSLSQIHRKLGYKTASKNFINNNPKNVRLSSINVGLSLLIIIRTLPKQIKTSGNIIWGVRISMDMRAFIKVEGEATIYLPFLEKLFL